jgi:hypothetical protein
MKRDIFYIAAIAIAIAWMWIQHNQIKNLKDDTKMRVIKHERDSLNEALKHSMRRERDYLALAYRTATEVGKAKEKISKTENKLHYYETKFKEIQKVHIGNLDSFFIARYPQQGARRDPYFKQMESRVDRSRLTEIRLFGLHQYHTGFNYFSIEICRSASDKTDSNTGGCECREKRTGKFVSRFVGQLHQRNSFTDRQGEAIQTAAKFNSIRRKCTKRIPVV